MVINGLSQFRGESDTGFRCKKLGGDTDCKSGGCHKHKDKKTFNDVWTVIPCNAHINDLGNYYRNKQIEHNFQKFEERCKNAFFLIAF